MSDLTPPTWLTIAQAASALSLSERQARRYAGKLDEADKQAPSSATGSPARVRLEAMRAIRDATRGAAPSSTKGPDITLGTLTQRAGHEPDIDLSVKVIDAGHEPDTLTVGAGHNTLTEPDMSRTPDAGHAPDAISSEREEMLLDQLARERELNAFFRSQIEEGNRNAQELRAALRKALEIAPRQLTTGAPDMAPSAPPEPSSAPDTTQVQSQPAAQPEPRPLWKVVLGIRS